MASNIIKLDVFEIFMGHMAKFGLTYHIQFYSSKLSILHTGKKSVVI